VCRVLACLTMKPVGELDAGTRHVQFDERGWETGRCRMAQAVSTPFSGTIEYQPAPGIARQDNSCSPRTITGLESLTE
jgi:hypothetical protein